MHDWVIDARKLLRPGGGDCCRGAHEAGTAAPVLSRRLGSSAICAAARSGRSADKQFDYAVCSHVLEDVDGIPSGSVRKSPGSPRPGYVEVPSRAVEQSTGIEHPRFYWLGTIITVGWSQCLINGVLEFRMQASPAARDTRRHRGEDAGSVCMTIEPATTTITGPANGSDELRDAAKCWNVDETRT